MTKFKTGIVFSLLLLASPAMFAQAGSSNGSQGPLSWMLGIPDWLQKLWKMFDPPPPSNYVPGEVTWKVTCENGVIVITGMYKTYPGVNKFDPNVGRNVTAIPCDEMESKDAQGGPLPNANSQAQPTNNTQNPPQGSSPPPAAGGGSPPKIARAALTGAATAVSAAALNITVPYRELGIVPFAPIKLTSPMVACDSSKNATVFVVNHLDASVTHYNICSGQTIASIAVTSNPRQVRITPDGAQAIVTSFDNAITFIDTTTNQVTKVLQASIHASGIAISGDGSYALITDFTDGAPAMSVLDIPNRVITGKISLNGRIYPQSVFLNPDNTLAYVTFPFDNAVEVIDILTGTLTQTLTVQYPLDVAFSPTGTIAYVASGAGTVQAIDTATYKTIASVPAGGGAVDLNVSPDGHTITVNNFLTNSSTVFDSRVMPFSVTSPVGAFPHGTAFVPVQ